MEGYQIIWLLKQLHIAMEQHGRESLGGYDMTPAQSLMLDYLLTRKGGVPYATDLHIESGISKSAISSTLKGLRKKGYLEMTIDPVDDRKKQIVLTDKARQAEQQIEASLQKRQACLCQEIPEQNLKILEESLRHMLANMKQENQRRNNA